MIPLSEGQVLYDNASKKRYEVVSHIREDKWVLSLLDPETWESVLTMHVSETWVNRRNMEIVTNY